MNLFKLRLGLYTSIAVFSLACSEKKESTKANLSSHSIFYKTEQINIDLNIKAEEKFSSLFDSVGYLLLEHWEEIPLVGNLKTVVTDKYIYIEDNELDNLFQYDHFGKLYNVLKSTGSGPSEFTQIEDFQIKNDTIIILDRVSAKLIYFDQYGKFVQESTLREEASNFHVGENYKLLFYSGYSNDSGNIFMKISKNGSKTPYFQLPENSTRGAVRLLHGFITDDSTNTLSITVPYTYDIAFIDTIRNLSKVKRFMFDNIPSNNEISNKPSQPERMDVFFPFPKFYFVTQFFNHQGYQFIFDRNFKLTYLGKNLQNDLDGMSLYIYPIAFNKDFLVLYFHSSTIYDIYRKSENEIKEKYPDAAIHQFVKQHTGDLQDDRHVLVFLKFNNNLFRKD